MTIDPNRQNPSDFVRREEGSWAMTPLVLGAILLALVGYYAFGGHGPAR